MVARPLAELIGASLDRLTPGQLRAVLETWDNEVYRLREKACWSLVQYYEAANAELEIA